MDLNASQAALNASAAGNATIGQEAGKAGAFALDKVLNSNWGDALAQFANGLLGQQFFSGTIMSALVPLVTLGLLYWKLSSLMGALGTVAKTLLILLMLYVVVHAFGVI